jgi:hypothetical protein
MRLTKPAAVLGLFLTLATMGQTQGAEWTRVRVGPAVFRAEVARTEEQRQRGLMFRRELPADQAMLFTQPPGQARFWMKNTLIPLDILYFDRDGTLLEILATLPPCNVADCPLYPSAAATVRYILEINGGEAARQEIRIGDQLTLE